VTPEQIVAACQDAGVRLVRFLYCDNGGIVRGKVVPVDRLTDRLRTGVGLTSCNRSRGWARSAR
jgi:glutamine synthetase